MQDVGPNSEHRRRADAQVGIGPPVKKRHSHPRYGVVRACQWGEAWPGGNNGMRLGPPGGQSAALVRTGRCTCLVNRTQQRVLTHSLTLLNAGNLNPIKHCLRLLKQGIFWVKSKIGRIVSRSGQPMGILLEAIFCFTLGEWHDASWKDGAKQSQQ